MDINERVAKMKDRTALLGAGGNKHPDAFHRSEQRFLPACPPAQPAYLVLVVVFAFASALLGGCGDQGPERVLVSGSVAYNGKPVTAGVIRFIPVAESQMPMAAAMIKDGTYKVDMRGGVPVGDYKVEIEAYHMADKSSTRMFQGASPRTQYLPDRYNKNSELQIAIESGSREITNDFDLTD